MTTTEVNQLLAPARPLNSTGADLLLDLRDLLLQSGHPGECVQCFFALLNNLESPQSLSALKDWLETHLEIALRIDGQTQETLPIRLGTSQSLHDYCHRVIDLVRHDRAYLADRVALTFQYRTHLAA
ncbi:MAG: hypothetical protein AAGC74_04920 [Verrucomicrobiota bacterium]